MAHGKKPKRPRPGQKPSAEDARSNPPSPMHVKVRISFELCEDGNDYCLSRCAVDECRSFLSCLRKLSERTWQQLLEGSSRNPSDKSGLNSTVYSKNSLTNPDIWPSRLSPDVTSLLGIRASERQRIYGVRIDNVFHVLWFDKNHEICRG
jgi:hypothetical protein